MNGRYDHAAIAIFIALILDGLDGRVARLTNTQSAFGSEFDSLSDMVSFGGCSSTCNICLGITASWQTRLDRFIYILYVRRS